MDANLQKLKKSLPYHYAKMIAEKLENIGPEKVRMVFSEEITDPDIVEKVLTKALELKSQLKRITVLKKKAATV